MIWKWIYRPVYRSNDRISMTKSYLSLNEPANYIPTSHHSKTCHIYVPGLSLPRPQRLLGLRPFPTSAAMKNSIIKAYFRSPHSRR